MTRWSATTPADWTAAKCLIPTSMTVCRLCLVAIVDLLVSTLLVVNVLDNMNLIFAEKFSPSISRILLKAFKLFCSYLSHLVAATADLPSRIQLVSASTHCYKPLTRLTFGERCFSHARPKAWNTTLCPEIQVLKNLNTFDQKLNASLIEHESSAL